MTRQHNARKARRLRNQGLTHKQIATQLGLSKNYVAAILRDPTGIQDKQRKQSYGGTCEHCGARTTGSNGPRKAPRICATCKATQTHEQRYWTKQRVLDAIHRYTKTNGRPPVASDWLTNNGQHQDGYPYVSTVTREFGSWANAIEAAGHPRPRIGHKTRTPTRAPRNRTREQRISDLRAALNRQN